jgi:hypothetical protein
MPRTNPIDVLKEMLLTRGIKITEDSFDETWFRDEPVDAGLRPARFQYVADSYQFFSR